MALYRIRTVLTSTLITGQGVATHYFDENGGTAQQAVTAIGNFWNALDTVMQESILWATEADVAKINSTTGALEGVVVTTPASGSGGTSQAQTTKATQGLIQWRTGTFPGGRELRGRTFIPGMPSGALTNGDPGTSYRSTLVTAGNGLMNDATCTLVVWSRKIGGFAPVTSVTSSAKAAVLRSRRD